jgi:hypothetical protein
MTKVFEPDKCISWEQLVEEAYKTIDKEANRIKKSRQILQKSNECVYA